MNISMESTIFHALDILPINETVIPTADAKYQFAYLGYELIAVPVTTEAFLIAKQKQIELVQDEYLPRLIKKQPNRGKIEKGNVQILSKNGQTYIAYSFNDEITIILNATEIDFSGVDETPLRGFNVENILMKSKSGNVIDMMSLRRGEIKPVKFSFM